MSHYQEREKLSLPGCFGQGMPTKDLEDFTVVDKLHQEQVLNFKQLTCIVTQQQIVIEQVP
jgi:hypothetical protein